MNNGNWSVCDQFPYSFYMRNKRIGIIVLSCIFYISLFCQKLDFVWLFGSHSNNGNQNTAEFNLDFNFNQPLFVLEFKQANFNGYTTSFCDSTGNLLLYSDGLKIWNSLHQRIENGFGLNPGIPADFALSNNISYPSAASGQVIKMPGQPDIYIMVHISEFIDDAINSIYYDRLYYTLIDMSANGGEGKVLEKNVILRESNLTYFGLCKHGNGRDWWLVVSDLGVNNYLVYLISSEGISGPNEYIIGPEFTDSEYAGLGLFTPDGTKYIRADFNRGPLIAHFDRCTGEIYDVELIPFDQPIGHGQFSAVSSDSKFAYFNSFVEILQADILNPSNSLDTIAKYDFALLPFPAGFYATQLGPDGKIYVASTNGQKVLHRIDRPDLPGESCNFIPHSFLPPKANDGAMPHFPNYRLGPVEDGPCDTLDVVQRPATWRISPWPERPMPVKKDIDITDTDTWRIMHTSRW